MKTSEKWPVTSDGEEPPASRLTLGVRCANCGHDHGDHSAAMRCPVKFEGNNAVAWHRELGFVDAMLARAKVKGDQ
jgi:hypothetical protein